MGLAFDVAGMDQVLADLERMRLPDKIVDNAARRGMEIVLKQAVANAPVRTGDLRRGVIMVDERSAVRPKKVYRIVFDRAMNDIFQKRYKIKKKVGRGKNSKIVDSEKTAYYPVSMEYGFYNALFGEMPGRQFIHRALEEKSDAAKAVIEAEITRELRKAGVK